MTIFETSLLALAWGQVLAVLAVCLSLRAHIAEWVGIVNSEDPNGMEKRGGELTKDVSNHTYGSGAPRLVRIFPVGYLVRYLFTLGKSGLMTTALR